MPHDFVSGLGLPFLAHRLRRTSELIVESTSAFIHAKGFRGPARSVSTLFLLRQEGAMSITEIAHRVRLSHPMVIKLVKALSEEGLTDDRGDPKDSRRRLVALTDKGLAQAALADALIAAIARAFAAMFEETGADLLAGLDRFEEAATARPLERRLEDEHARRARPAEMIEGDAK